MKKLALIILAGFAAFSCAKDPLSGGEQHAKGITVRFTTPDFDQVTTRATNETLINDVWVLQYKGGSLANAPLHLRGADGVAFTQAIELTGLVDMPFAANAADSLANFVCFLANLDAAGVANADVAALTTVDALNAFKLDVNQTTTGTVLPMSALYYGGISTAATNQLNVSLQRSVAKVNFTYNADNFKAGGENVSFSLVSIKLCQTPKQFTIVKNPLRPALPVGYNNGLLPQDFAAYPAGNASEIMMEITENLATTTTGFMAYVAENARGSFDGILNNKMKNPVGSAIAEFAAQADFCTYIELTGEYVDGSAVKQATYKIYLGGNATGDMNILANTTYNVTTYLYGANIADTRITVNEIFNESSLTNLKKPANSYIINADAGAQTFTVPLIQVVNGWTAINATIGSAQADQRVDIADLFSNEANWSAQLLWKTWQGDNVTAVPTGAVLKRYMTVTVPGTIENGNNAVIALYDRRPASATKDQIIWSWHLWFTDYNPSLTDGTAMNGQLHQYISNAFQPGGAHAGKYVMDRNLGATWTVAANGSADIATKMTNGSTDATPSNAVKTLGLLYQWGRKDPFTNTTDTGTGTTPAITTSTPIYDKDNNLLTEGTGSGTGINSVPVIPASASNVMSGIQNPLTFFATNGDWTGVGATANEYWGGTGAKGAFDPCPEGYRIPKGGTSLTNNVWAGFNGQPITEAIVNGGQGDVFKWYESGVQKASGNSRTAGRLFDDSSTKAWIPASGNRNAASGAFGSVGSTCFNWSGAVSGTGGFNLSCYSAGVSPANGGFRAFGFPVRCVQE